MRRLFINSCLSLLCTLALVAWGGNLAAQTSWTIARTNLPGVGYGHSVAFGNGRFVATFSGLTTATTPVAWSTDGLTWTAGSGTVPSQGSIVFAAGAFHMAAGTGVFRSVDGVAWQQLYNNPLSLRGIATNGRSMLVGSSNINATSLVFSADLVTWRQTAPLPNLAPGDRLSFSDAGYVAGRYFVSYDVMPTGGGRRNYVVSTVDGTGWTAAPALDGAFNLASGSGRLLAWILYEGEIRATRDGTTFTRAPIAPGLTNGGYLRFAGGRFFFLGSLQASTTGLTWAELAPATLPAIPQINSIAYGNGRYVAVGATTGPIDVIATLQASAPPVIASAPFDRTVAEGTTTTFAVTLQNPDTATTFQWLRRGQAIAGATNPTLTLAATSLADAGEYVCEIRNSIGSGLTDGAVLTVVPVAQAGRLVNLSVLTTLDSAGGDFSVGYVVGGAGTSGSKALLVRAGGPSLARFGIGNGNPDPRLEVFGPAARIGGNDDWAGTAELSAVSARVGAFPFLAGDSKDAAFFSTAIPRGNNSAKVSAAAGAAGTVIAEIYDATPETEITTATPRLINVSVIKTLAADETISAGFVIGGRTAKRILLRAIGPTLGSSFGLTDVMANPRIAVFRQVIAASIAANDDWAGAANLQPTMAAVGAFALDAASKDAVLLAELAPGSYSAQATGDAAGGTVLVEIYEVP